MPPSRAGILAQNADRAGAIGFILDFFTFAPRNVAIACTLVIIGALAEGFGLTLIIPLFQLVSQTPGSNIPTPLAQLYASLAANLPGAIRAPLIIAAFCVAMIVRSIVATAREVASTAVETKYTSQRQIELIDALASASWATLSRLRHTRVTSILTNDIYQVGVAATGLLHSTTAIITLAMQMVIALTIAPFLTLAAMGLLAGMVLLFLPLQRASRALGAAVADANLAMLDDTAQFLGALKVAKSQNAQTAFIDSFAAGRQEIRKAEVSFMQRRGRANATIAIIGVLAASIIAWLGLTVFHVGPASLLALLVLLARMSAPVTELQAFSLAMWRAVPPYENLRALAASLRVSGQTGITNDPLSFQAIEFRNVTFHHRSEDGGAAGGLASFDLSIHAGEFIGIVGASGAGKTTFADLLVGLYDPDEGEILVDGKPVTLSREAGWRERIAYIPQDLFLYHQSIRANLRWASPAATEEQMIAALCQAGAEPLVQRLPKGLDTVVGERGSLVSGGERQRLALARALLRDPQLLILDEATNAIDITTERDLLRRISEMKITTVMIAHRWESLERCTRVVLVNQGQVAASGSPADVRASAGRLASAQIMSAPDIAAAQ